MDVDAIRSCLQRLWAKGETMRSERSLSTRKSLLRGRAGKARNLRRHYLFAAGSDACILGEAKFIPFSECREVDSRGRRGESSKIQLIRGFLEKNGDRAFYSVDVRTALEEKGVRQADVMYAVRVLERKGLVYVRGYRLGEGQTPFDRGYLITWIQQDKLRDEALREAVDRTTCALEGSVSTHPLIHRVHVIRDTVLTATHLKDLVSYDQLTQVLDCAQDEANGAVKRALQLYPDLREEKLFGAYRYYDDTSISPGDLAAALELKQNYVRKTKGRHNRIGHNWEACVEWFKGLQGWQQWLVARTLDVAHHWWIGALLMIYWTNPEAYWFGAGLFLDDLPDIPLRIKVYLTIPEREKKVSEQDPPTSTELCAAYREGARRHSMQN